MAVKSWAELPDDCGKKGIIYKGLAEREGFEPSVQVLARTTV